jgi:acetyltransferase-like isoleucine patch superfamily enzyme
MIFDEKAVQANFTMGQFSYFGRDAVIIAYDEKTKLTIGNYCSIAADCTFILGGQHNYNWLTTYPFNDPELKKDKPALPISSIPYNCFHGHIIIGNDVWIGNGCTILSGVTIDDGAVIGAGSVVRPKIYNELTQQWHTTIPAYSIIIGNPAIIVGYRFNAYTIEKMLKMKWWNWPQGHINHAVERGILQSDGIENLWTYWCSFVDHGEVL